MKLAIPKQSCSFILNLIDIKCDLPIEVIPDHYLDKATNEQIDSIRPVITDFTKYTMRGAIIEFNPYEDAWVQKTNGKGTTLKKLPRTNWKYWVLNFKGSNEHIHNLQYAANLSRTGFEFGFSFLGNIGFQMHALTNFNYFNDLARSAEKVKTVELDDIKELSENYNLVVNLNKSFQEILRVIHMYDTIKWIPKQSNFVVLGYFAIIEALLTHSPSPKETGDSITRQLRTKIPLLIHRWDEPIDYTHYFGSVSEDKIWTKLYRFRSCIAHGIQPDFKKELTILKTEINVISFLKHLTRKLLVQSLKEPELVMDLKNC